MIPALHPAVCGLHLTAWRITQTWHWATIWRVGWRRLIAGSPW